MKWGKHHHTLSELDLDDFDDYEIMQSGSRNAAAGAFKPLGPPLPKPIGSLDVCWCGQPMGHDWPGRGDGQPHPS